MNNQNINERFASMLRKSREDANKSQDYIAKKLGVSKKTVQNWECGYSSPSLSMGFEWFEVLGLQPIPYYLSALYPTDFTGNSFSDIDVDKMLVNFIKSMRPSDKRKLLFVIYGEHGSAFNELIEMLVAHFHTPDSYRIIIAQNILTHYLLAQAENKLVALEHIKPDLDILKKAILKKRNRILGTDD